MAGASLDVQQADLAVRPGIILQVGRVQDAQRLISRELDPELGPGPALEGHRPTILKTSTGPGLAPRPKSCLAHW